MRIFMTASVVSGSSSAEQQIKESGKLILAPPCSVTKLVLGAATELWVCVDVDGGQGELKPDPV
jgi:hypothetical protein